MNKDKYKTECPHIRKCPQIEHLCFIPKHIICSIYKAKQGKGQREKVNKQQYVLGIPRFNRKKGGFNKQRNNQISALEEIEKIKNKLKTNSKMKFEWLKMKKRPYKEILDWSWTYHLYYTAKMRWIVRNNGKINE